MLLYKKAAIANCSGLQLLAVKVLVVKGDGFAER